MSAEPTRPDIPAAKVCEHFYASHCYRGMSIRLCMLCHEPDWDDLAGQLDAARGAVASVSAPEVTSPAPAPAKPPGASTEPHAPVSDAAVQAALDAVAPFWKEAHAILQAYPSAALARAMLEGAARLIAAERAEQAEAKLAAQSEYDTYRRALWVMVRQFGGSVFLTSGQMEDVPLLASLGVGREPGGIRINAGEEP